MEKTMTLNLRVNPTVKQQAEDVLKQLGIPMATAIDMYLRQITLTGGIPFSLSLPKAPAALNADTMTDDQLHAALQVGIKEIQNGDTVDAASAFAQFREQHRCCLLYTSGTGCPDRHGGHLQLHCLYDAAGSRKCHHWADRHGPAADVYKRQGHTWDNLQRDICGFTIKSQKVLRKKGRESNIWR